MSMIPLESKRGPKAVAMFRDPPMDPEAPNTMRWQPCTLREARLLRMMGFEVKPIPPELTPTPNSKE